MNNAARLDNLHVLSQDPLPSPQQIRAELPATPQARQVVADAREAIERVLARQDERLLAVVGPCSIHDPVAALDYAARLRALAGRVSDVMLVVMRVYFEKPRTTVGWKGLVNDPRMDDSFRIDEGLRVARRLLAALNDMGLPCGTEALDPISPQYLGDLVAWNAIGARTTESQTHREMASGLSTPVGFKNGTDGGLEVAVNAMLAAGTPHAFLGVDGSGRAAIVRTTGNRFGHLILRGGAAPNFDAASIAQACAQMRAAGLPANVVVDCSHGNSRKDHRRQAPVLADVVAQRVAGNRDIVGVMLESNLHEGAQKLVPGCPLRYGVSITDACLSWEQTEAALLEAAEALREAAGREARATRLAEPATQA